MPADASLNGQGFRFYSWKPDLADEANAALCREYEATEETDVLSVTSIRKLAGESYGLVVWQINNVVNVSTGTRQAVKIGPRGGVQKVYVKDGPFPGEFVTRMVESRGSTEKLADLRKWLKSRADEPRDVAAVRGSVVHKLIEINAKYTDLDDDFVIAKIDSQWDDEKRRVKVEVTEDDVNFVRNGIRQYWNMRERVPFVILAQEPQVWNLRAGYAGSIDSLVWFLPESEAHRQAYWQKEARNGRVTIDTIAEVGPPTDHPALALGDWKTSAGVYTDHVVQVTAYLAGSFIATQGRIDKRLSDILSATIDGMIVHVRPDGWAVDFFGFQQDVVRAFLGSVAFARFLALHPKPDDIFTERLSGQAPDTEPSSDEEAA